MITRGRFQILILTLALLFAAGHAKASTLSESLQSRLAGAANDAPVGVVIVAFNNQNGLNDSHLAVLRGVGINKGLTLQRLGMVAMPATAGQVRQLAANPAVRSVWSNDQLYYYMNQARMLTGVDKLRTDAAMTRANGGKPVSGAGDFSVVINDSGIDATHSDLKYGTKVIQNVQLITDTDTLAGFTSLVAVEGVPNTDTHVGHGTHCAGILGGTGQASGGIYTGVAPGAKIIGLGSGYGLFVLNALGGLEWSLANQFVYNIRVISNSWGSSGPFNPDNPINLATRRCYDNNIVIVFSAGNSGPGKDSHNPYSKAPWVISVAAGTKEGELADFSSRGLPRGERLGNSDPLDDFDAPTITAPGTGRKFDANSAKFTAAIVSTRSSSNVVANGLTDDTEISPAFLPFYTQISGTSMACPHVAGVVALMLDANPALSFDEIKNILVQTATRMPGRDDYEVGAGYVNAYAAVDKVFNPSKPYGSFVQPTFYAPFSIETLPTEAWHIDFTPAGLPGPGSANSKTFTVEEGVNVLDVFARADNIAESGDGNTYGILLTSPSGVTYSSGIAIPILDGTTRQILVKNPVAGQWLLEVRGVRGVTTAPGVSLPTSGAALPGPVDGTIVKQRFHLQPIADIQNHAAREQIEFVLKNRMMDTFTDGTFRPDSVVSREDFARSLMLNTPLRQSLSSTPVFNDVTGSFSAIAEAVTAKGSTLRDWNFVPAGVISATAPTFNPTGATSRLDLAVALVRALGLDTEAKALANTNVTVTYSGQTLTLADNAQIPLALRGYVQLALDRGILQAYFTLEQGPFDLQPKLTARVKPADAVTRAWLAFALDNYFQRYMAGN